LPMHKEFLVAENKFREIIIYIYGDYWPETQCQFTDF
jgi:hypothetical protein